MTTSPPHNPPIPIPPAIAEEEPAIDELPPRPRHRMLGAGGNPTQVALLGVLLTACGFIGGVLVEKGQTSSSASGGGLVALRGSAAGGFGRGSGGSAAAAVSGGSAASGAAAGGSGAAAGGLRGRFAAAGATIGEVAYISGSTLYVSDFEGNTIKVKTSAASSITKTVKSGVRDIHPGETVVVRGAREASGTVNAESVSVGGASGALGGLFGGGGGGPLGGARGGASSDARGGAGAAGGESLLFGK